MASLLKKAFAPLVLALALTGCGENPQDIAKKPAVINAMVQNSLDVCNKGPVNGDAASYETRLRGVLGGNRTAALQEMQNQKLTVCLDQRLSQQKTGTWDARVKAVMYKNGDKGGIVSLWDDGRPSSEDTFWTRNTRNWGATDIRQLAYAFQHDRIGASNNLLYADAESCGRHCTTIYWHTPQRFDQDTQRKNPELAKPPVPLPAATPKPAS